MGSQEGADLLRSERVGAGRHTSEQRVLLGILHAELLKVCSCLGHLVTKRGNNSVNLDTGLRLKGQHFIRDNMQNVYCSSRVFTNSKI